MQSGSLSVQMPVYKLTVYVIFWLTHKINADTVNKPALIVPVILLETVGRGDVVIMGDFMFYCLCAMKYIRKTLN